MCTRERGRAAAGAAPIGRDDEPAPASGRGRTRLTQLCTPRCEARPASSRASGRHARQRRRARAPNAVRRRRHAKNGRQRRVRVSTVVRSRRRHAIGDPNAASTSDARFGKRAQSASGGEGAAARTHRQGPHARTKGRPPKGQQPRHTRRARPRPATGEREPPRTQNASPVTASPTPLWATLPPLCTPPLLAPRHFAAGSPRPRLPPTVRHSDTSKGLMLPGAGPLRRPDCPCRWSNSQDPTCRSRPS